MQNISHYFSFLLFLALFSPQQYHIQDKNNFRGKKVANYDRIIFMEGNSMFNLMDDEILIATIFIPVIVVLLLLLPIIVKGISV